MKQIYRLVINSKDYVSGSWNDGDFYFNQLLQEPVDTNSTQVFCYVESFCINLSSFTNPIQVCLPMFPLVNPPYYTTASTQQNIVLTTIDNGYYGNVQNKLIGHEVSDPSLLVRGSRIHVQVLDTNTNQPLYITGGSVPKWTLTLTFWAIDRI